jgi:hypothetical protein
VCTVFAVLPNTNQCLCGREMLQNTSSYLVIFHPIAPLQPLSLRIKIYFIIPVTI